MIDAGKRSAEEKRREKARNLRFKKPACKTLNWQSIVNDLWDMVSDISDVQWMTEDDEVLVNALDSEDEAYEFKIAFSDLQTECQRMQEDMEEAQRAQQAYFFSRDSADEDEVPEMFNLFFPAVGADDDIYGFDTYEGDYMGLDLYSSEAAAKEARKKLQRLTKEQIIDLSGICLRIAQQYLSLRYRYDCLSAAIDILKGQNEGVLQVVRHIEELYGEADKATDGFKYKYHKSIDALDRALREMPERLWIE